MMPPQSGKVRTSKTAQFTPEFMLRMHQFIVVKKSLLCFAGEFTFLAVKWLQIVNFSVVSLDPPLRDVFEVTEITIFERLLGFDYFIFVLIDMFR